MYRMMDVVKLLKAECTMCCTPLKRLSFIISVYLLLPELFSAKADYIIEWSLFELLSPWYKLFSEGWLYSMLQSKFFKSGFCILLWRKLLHDMNLHCKLWQGMTKTMANLDHLTQNQNLTRESYTRLQCHVFLIFGIIFFLVREIVRVFFFFFN